MYYYRRKNDKLQEAITGMPMDISKETQESLAISGFLRYDKENAAENLPINHEILRGTTVSPWGKEDYYGKNYQLYH